MELPEGLKFTPCNVYKDFFGKQFLVGRLEVSTECIKKKLVEYIRKCLVVKKESKALS